MVSVMLMVKSPGDARFVGAGQYRFEVLPRNGELVELEVEGKAYMYKIVAVHHPGEPASNAADLYAVRVGLTLDVASALDRDTSSAVLSKIERRLMSNQYKILELVDPNEAGHYARCREVLESGYELNYDLITLEEPFPKELCQEVINVLVMYESLQRSYKKHGTKSGKDEWEVSFKGFDGNNETDHLGYARFVIQKDGRFTYLEMNEDLNSHQLCLARYHRMLDQWEASCDKYDLTIEDLVKVLDA